MSNIINDPKEQYCAYLRKSRADHDAELRGEEETLARHRRILTEVSEAMRLPISRFYCEVVSGDTISDRPVVQELLADVESGRWTGVFVVEVERLARGNTKDQGIVSDAFKYSGTKIITPTKTYDPNNEFDEEYFEFGLFMSRREYKTINRRLQRGRIASVKEGNYISGTAPYGYRKVKNTHEKGYTLEIVPEQAEVVRLIFDWYCHGELLPDGTYSRLGTDSIASRLDAMGFPPTSNSTWSKATISDMIRNKTYCGYVFFGRQKEVKQSINGNIVKVRRSSDDYVCVKGKHPAIIPEDLFDLSQKVRQENTKNTLPSSAVLQNPLSGLVYCKKCGRMLTRLAPNTRNKYATLKCPNRYCDNVSSPLFLVEEQVLSFLQNWLDNYEINSGSFQDLAVDKEIETKKQALLKLETDYAALQKQLNRAYDLLEQEVYTLDVFRHRQHILKTDMEALENNREIFHEELQKLQSMKEEAELFAPRVRHLLESYEGNTVEANNRILKEVISKILYEKTEPNRRGGLHNANFVLNIYPRIPL